MTNEYKCHACWRPMAVCLRDPCVFARMAVASRIASSETLATYTIQVLTAEENPDRDKRVLADLPAMLEAVEEDLTDLLPEGYEARIREWNEE